MKTCLMTVLLLSAAAATTAHARTHRIQLVNDTGHTITAFSAAGPGSDRWVRFRLEPYGLADGEARVLRIDYRGPLACHYDVKVELAGGRTLQHPGIDLCASPVFLPAAALAATDGTAAPVP